MLDTPHGVNELPAACCDTRSNRKPSVAFTPALVQFSIVTHKCQLVWSEVNSHDRQEKKELTVEGDDIH